MGSGQSAHYPPPTFKRATTKEANGAGHPILAKEQFGFDRRVGLFVTEQVSLTKPGADGIAQIKAAMTRFRGKPPKRSSARWRSAGP